MKKYWVIVLLSTEEDIGDELEVYFYSNKAASLDFWRHCIGYVMNSSDSVHSGALFPLNMPKKWDDRVPDEYQQRINFVKNYIENSDWPHRGNLL